jgi:hypothetical protein
MMKVQSERYLFMDKAKATFKSQVNFLVSGIFFSLLTTLMPGQVKITDGVVLTMDPNSLLELESTSRGLLIPRVAINNLTLPAPLSAPVPAGMLVYSSGGAVPDGFYFWKGSAWEGLKNVLSSIIRTSDTLLTKNVNLIYAKNDITLTLPAVTTADEGLEITVKHTGTYTDLITVVGSSGATIDGDNEINILPKWGKTFVAHNSNWVLKERNRSMEDFLDVGPGATFSTIEEAIEFLNEHMESDKIIRLTSDITYISEPVVIDLPYSLTIEGSSYGSGTIEPASGLAGKPMFRCLSDTYFKMLIFDGTTLAGYATTPGSDAIRFSGSGTYNEIKDTSFEGFFNGIVDSTDAELWVFECDFLTINGTGIILHSPSAGAVVKISETDFTDCVTGVSLSSGTSSEFQLMSGVFTNQAGGTCVHYDPAHYSFELLVITNNSWNYLGNGITGFDFTRSDGRDSNAIIENNAMAINSTPHCKINVINYSGTTTCNNANTWYKANFTTTTTLTTNLYISNNRVTYQPARTMDLVINISGNVQCNNSNRNITIALVKNGITTTRYGESTLRITTSNQPFQYSSIVYIEDVTKNDYFELYCSSANSGDILTFQDIHIYYQAH